MGAFKIASLFFPSFPEQAPTVINFASLGFVVVLLTEHWLPLGPSSGFVRNLIFASGIIFGLLGIRRIFTAFYSPFLKWPLYHKAAFLMLPSASFSSGWSSGWVSPGFFFIPWTVDRLVGTKMVVHRPTRTRTAGQKRCAPPVQEQTPLYAGAVYGRS